MKIKKWYRVFLICTDKSNVQSPTLPEWLDTYWNWYDTIDDAEINMPYIIEQYSKPLVNAFTILPVYEIGLKIY